MTEKSILAKIMKDRGCTQAELARLAGYKDRRNVAILLNGGKSLRTDILVKLMECLGQEVVIRDKKTGVEYVVRGEEE